METAAATGEVVRDSDRIQGELGEGPCFNVAEYKEQVYRVADMGGSGERWPRYAPKAHELDIGEALGIVMERYKTTEDQAFEILKKSSQHRNVKLRDLAPQATETGETPKRTSNPRTPLPSGRFVPGRGG